MEDWRRARGEVQGGGAEQGTSLGRGGDDGAEQGISLGGGRAGQGIPPIRRGNVQGEGGWGAGRTLLPKDLLTRAGARRLLLYVEVAAELLR